MSDERPIDLRSLDVEPPEVVRASIQRFRRRILLWAFWTLVFVAAGSAILGAVVHGRNQDSQALIAADPSENTSIGNYRVGAIDVGLLKVVRLPGNQIGMEFVLHSDAPLAGCCSIFPHPATWSENSGAAGGRFGHVLVSIPASSVSSAGTLDMLLIRSTPPTIRLPFTVDLHALGVAGIGG